MQERQPPINIDEDYWVDILDTVDIQVIPVSFLKTVSILFNDGRVWELPLTDDDDSPETLGDLMEDYGDDIKSVDFQIDLERIKEESIKVFTHLK